MSNKTKNNSRKICHAPKRGGYNGKILTVVLVAVTVFSVLLAFVGCEKPSPAPSPAPTPTPDPVGDSELTYQDLLQSHKSSINDFFTDTLSASINAETVGGAQSWRLLDSNGDNKIEKAQITLISKVDEETRAFELVDLNFTTPISAQAIKEHDLEGLKTTTTRTTLFTFDAKYNFEHAELVDAIWSTTTNTSPIKVVCRTADTGDYANFQIFVCTDDTYSIQTIHVLKYDGSDATLIENIAKNYYATSNGEEHYFHGDKVYTGNAYVQEQFEIEGPELPNPDPVPVPDDPTPPDPVVTITDDQVIQALNENCLRGITKKCFAGMQNINTNKVQDASWYITKDDSGLIVRADCLMQYQDNSTGSYVAAGYVTFTDGVSMQDLVDGNLPTVKYTSTMGLAENFYYNPTIQSEHTALTNALCDLLFGELEEGETATRLIKINDYTTDTILNSMAQRYTVVQIKDGKIEEKTISIKSADSDADYIEKLGNSNNYRIINQKSYTISGEQLVDATATGAN